MRISPALSIRSDSGLTSNCYLDRRLLTGSTNGDLCIWDLESGNTLASWRLDHDITSVLPLQSNGTIYCLFRLIASNSPCTNIFPGSSLCNILALQHKSGFSLFDINTGSSLFKGNVYYSNFARIRCCSTPSPLLLCPSGLNSIICHDLRTSTGRPYTSCGSSFSSSPSIEIPAPGEKDADVGSLQNIEPLPFLSNYHIVTTYECGLVSIFDIRSHREPLIKRKLEDSETLLSLGVWRSVLLVGDTGGNISMLHVSDPNGIIPLERINICKGVDSPCGIGCLRVREDGAITVACCWDYTVRVLETRSLEVKAILGDHNDTIMDVSFDRLTGDFATCSLDGNGYMWNLFSSSYKRV